MRRSCIDPVNITGFNRALLDTSKPWIRVIQCIPYLARVRCDINPLYVQCEPLTKDITCAFDVEASAAPWWPDHSPGVLVVASAWPRSLSTCLSKPCPTRLGDPPSTVTMTLCLECQSDRQSHTYRKNAETRPDMRTVSGFFSENRGDGTGK
ncbi:hypothetical protein ElyMa_001821300 [Elysia marginata]|uniref:Uncharacterized protein n=1 Tax=Elysia marginata TaxID=1093978 RepID=A0AAV4EIT9_9GAST|nr:hypothetical protein ElyMa_001821300 [Elysia marginata]